MGVYISRQLYPHAREENLKTKFKLNKEPLKARKKEFNNNIQIRTKREREDLKKLLIFKRL